MCFYNAHQILFHLYFVALVCTILIQCGIYLVLSKQKMIRTINSVTLCILGWSSGWASSPVVMADGVRSLRRHFHASVHASERACVLRGACMCIYIYIYLYIYILVCLCEYECAYMCVIQLYRYLLFNYR